MQQSRWSLQLRSCHVALHIGLPRQPLQPPSQHYWFCVCCHMRLRALRSCHMQAAQRSANRTRQA